MFPARWLGVSGLFIAILVALSSTHLFIFLCNIKALRIRFYAEGSDAAVAQSFTALLPGVITVVLACGFNFAFKAITGGSIHVFVHQTVLSLFTLFDNSVHTTFLYTLLNQILWFLGIHGSNILDSVMKEYYQNVTQGAVETLLQDLPVYQISTKSFVDIYVLMGGSGTTLSLLIALLLAKSRSSRRLAHVSLLPVVFNINEFILFGLPIILNPVFALPFIIVPLFLLLFSYGALLLGWVPPIIHSVHWTMPPLLNAYLATDSINASLLQCAGLLLGALIYLPFVRAFDRFKAERLHAAMAGLMDVSCRNVESSDSKKCISRDDEIGSLARSLANDLQRALAQRKGLFVVYQPQVDHQSGAVIGAEALIRWQHERHGLIPAPIIVALAEDIDLIDALGLWVLETACAERQRWHDAGVPESFELSVNVSVNQLSTSKLPQQLRDCLVRYKLKDAMVGVEVTESAALDPEANHNRILRDIVDSGIGVSIDDFGMGHGSLLYLRYFPIGTLKIDRVLTEDIANNHVCAEIVATIIDLCKTLKINVVAEFVETDAQIAVLRKAGCFIFQGYYFSKPLSGEDALSYIKNYSQS